MDIFGNSTGGLPIEGGRPRWEERMKFDLNLITLKMVNHARHSGYDRLADYMNGRVISAPAEWTFVQRLIVKCLSVLAANPGVTWYHRDSIYGEAAAASQWLRSSHQVFHFIYGENGYRYLGGLKKTRMKNAIVCTYHTPPEKFTQLIPNPFFLKQLDAVIVVSRSQQRFFSDLVGDDRVFFVPHGIDVQYFTPEATVTEPTRARGKFQCLFVGSHLRDFEVLSKAIKTLAERDPDIHFCGVIPDRLKASFSGLPNVTLTSGIPDAELRRLYQRSDLLVLPLIEATANNSILEAMACGLPIVSTDLAGTRDYVDASCARLTGPGDVRGIVEAVLALKADRQRLAEMSENIRSRALGFSWKNVAARMRQVYRSLFEAGLVR